MKVTKSHLSRKSSATSLLLGKMLSGNVILSDQRKNLGISLLLVKNFRQSPGSPIQSFITRCSHRRFGIGISG